MGGILRKSWRSRSVCLDPQRSQVPRPPTANIAFGVAAFLLRMSDDAVAAALEINYASSIPTPSRRAVYIRRTMMKARMSTGINAIYVPGNRVQFCEAKKAVIVSLLWYNQTRTH